LIDKGDVSFKINQSRLDKQSKAVLDEIAQKAKSTPRAVINLEGFADKYRRQSVQFNAKP
jgi:outer membrane protein OmpA-like peptidoglycan-associated protein